MQVDITKSQDSKVQSNSLIKRIAHSPEVGIFIPLLSICVITTVINPSFATATNLLTVLKMLAFIAIVALGESLVIIVAEIDISVGKLAGLGTMIFAYMLIVAKQGVLVAALSALLVGTAAGFINGFMVTYLGLSNFIATIGMFYVAGGARYLLTKGYPLYPLPYNLGDIGKATPLGLSWSVIIAVILFVIVGLMLKKTIFGRRLYATGDNKEVAALAGINVKWMKISAYMICGFLASLAGILLAIETNSGLPASGEGWEFKAIASCAVGGISLAGGMGSALGVAIGVIIINVLDNSLIMLGVDSNLQKVATGVVLAGAVIFDMVKRRRKVKA